ncbi:MAG TPA: SRPBCC domain-containing protein [Gemmatimonadales bacterium]|nr:SRPBCC domain-containing protein [Gemmatimonadales bacterium]
MNNGKIEFAYELYIAAPAEQVWKGLIDAAATKQYVYGTRLQSSLKRGAPYAYLADGDFRVVDGRIIEIEPAQRLVMTWSAHWDDAVAQDPPSRVTYQLTAIDPTTTKLCLVHDDFASETATYTGSVASWPLMLSSLKSLLETGKAIAVK